MRFSDFCRDVFLLAQRGVYGNGTGRGTAWEETIAEYLRRTGIPADALPGGAQVFGHAALSGLQHQIDGCFECSDALLIAEWKAHRGVVPKNEVLRFKAVTDDYLYAFRGGFPQKPVFRVFGGIGHMSESVRMYAAIHGIVLVEPHRWPAPWLADRTIVWPDRSCQGPRDEDRQLLRSLSRPVQTVLRPRANGGFLIPPPPSPSAVSAALLLHVTWSDRLWEAFDTEPGVFEELIDQRVGRRVA